MSYMLCDCNVSCVVNAPSVVPAMTLRLQGIPMYKHLAVPGKTLRVHSFAKPLDDEAEDVKRRWEDWADGHTSGHWTLMTDDTDWWFLF